MSGRFRSRRGYRRFGGFRRSRYSRSSGLRRRARGNMRAANQQSDTSDVVINLMTKVKSGVTGAADTPYGTSASNIFQLLRKSEFFSSYSNMYDQFRITSIKVKVTPVSWKTYDQFNIPTAVAAPAGQETTGTAVPALPEDGRASPPEYLYPQALTVVTAWDRTGLDTTQYLFDDNQEIITIGDAITTYSSAKSQQLVAGATFNCVRYLYPSSQQEKSLYFSTNDLADQYNIDANDAYYVKTASGQYSAYNICNVAANPNCPFKPIFLLGILKVEDVAYGATEDLTRNKINPVTFNLEFDIGVTFRGLRKAQVV